MILCHLVFIDIIYYWRLQLYLPVSWFRVSHVTRNAFLLHFSIDFWYRGDMLRACLLFIYHQGMFIVYISSNGGFFNINSLYWLHQLLMSDPRQCASMAIYLAMIQNCSMLIIFVCTAHRLSFVCLSLSLSSMVTNICSWLRNAWSLLLIVAKLIRLMVNCLFWQHCWWHKRCGECRNDSGF